MSERQSITAYLVASDAAAAIDFYKSVLGAEEPGARITMPGGKVGHAELKIGNSTLYLADEFPDIGALSPKSVGGCPVMLSVMVPDVDVVAERARAAGARMLGEIQDKFYGDRTGQFEDPFGFRWSIATQIEEVTPEELERRAAEMFGEG